MALLLPWNSLKIIYLVYKVRLFWFVFVSLSIWSLKCVWWQVASGTIFCILGVLFVLFADYHTQRYSIDPGSCCISPVLLCFKKLEMADTDENLDNFRLPTFILQLQILVSIWSWLKKLPARDLSPRRILQYELMRRAILTFNWYHLQGGYQIC